MEKRKLIIDQDAGVDDLAAIAIAILSNQFVVRAITIAPADSFKDPAIQITLGLLKFLNRKDIDVTASDNEGVNLFPEKWRNDSVRMSGIPDIEISKAEYADYGFSETASAQKLVELLNSNEQFEILATGPLSNIADALKINPNISRNIQKIYFMGGAFDVHGNVERPNHDLTAEWNVYNNPNAVNVVLQHNIPLVFVSLDATNCVPVTPGFMNNLRSQKSAVSQLFYKVWKIISPQIGDIDYQKKNFFWDTLTSAFAATPNLGELINKHVIVVESGISEGRTIFDPKGSQAQILTNPNPKALEKYILEVLR